MKSKPTALILALTISSLSAWSCSKSTPPAADDKPAAAPAPAPAAAPATPAATPATPAAPKPMAATPMAAPVAAPVVAPAATPAPAVAKAAASAAPADSNTTGADPHSDIKTLVPEVLRLLEAKDYAGFLKMTTPPSQLAALPMPLDQMASMLGSIPGAADELNNLAQALTQIKDKTPTLDDTGNKATFPLDPPVGDHKDISFVKENGMWYLD